jgi:hypothetical protein
VFAEKNVQEVWCCATPYAGTARTLSGYAKMSNLIIWDIETVPDLKGFAAANGHDGRGDVVPNDVRPAPTYALRADVPFFVRTGYLSSSDQAFTGGLGGGNLAAEGAATPSGCTTHHQSQGCWEKEAGRPILG